jgi:para-nitrobenzyl esterase
VAGRPRDGPCRASLPQPLPPSGSFYQKEFFLTSERQSEDCLYLNLWAPTRAPGDGLPVMVWFYGGGFVQGSGSLPSFDGEALAHRGVIVVTINYRLGPLGFLALPALDEESPVHVSGNYGLRWVQNNVGGFGGDPDNVTIFGQSAGAFGVNAMMASPLAQGTIPARDCRELSDVRHLRADPDSRARPRRVARNSPRPLASSPWRTCAWLRALTLSGR